MIPQKYQHFLLKFLIILFVINTAIIITGCSGYPESMLKVRKKSDLQLRNRNERMKKLKVNRMDNCTCGMRSLEQLEQVKIVGGQLSKEQAWPWIVALIYTGDSSPMQFCGSSLINTQYVLTAAHCTVEMNEKGLDQYQAYLGTNSISDTNSIKLNISEVKIHPKFVGDTLENDLSLLKLNEPVVFSGRVRPVCLKQAMSPYVGRSGFVVGWGSIREGGFGVDKLREAKVTVINNVDCAKNYSTVKTKISGQMMCAAGNGPKDSCQGDSGGPLIIWNPRTKAFCQMGIVSFGKGCGKSGFPGVYTRVYSFIKWIQDNTKDASYCQNSF